MISCRGVAPASKPASTLGGLKSRIALKPRKAVLEQEPASEPAEPASEEQMEVSQPPQLKTVIPYEDPSENHPPKEYQMEQDMENHDVVEAAAYSLSPKTYSMPMPGVSV